MKKSSSEQQPRIRKQFDSFCKTLLKNEMIDYERERNYRLKYEISFSELTQKELRQLEIMDDYIVESEMFHVFDYDIEVKDKDVLEEFIKRVEKTLSEDSIEDKIEKLNRSVYNIQYKRKKLLENYLEGVVAKDIYEETDVGYEKKLSEAKTQLSMLEQQYDNEGSLQRRLADFRKALSKNQILEEFDRGIFESIIEKVIVGGYDENGEKDPYKIIFIYKTGFKNEIGNAKERFGKKSKAVETVKEMCSHIVDEVKDVCSYVSDNTCGDGMFNSSDELVEILYFSHFTSYMTFLPTGKKGRKKQRKSSIEVSVALHLVTGDTSNSL